MRHSYAHCASLPLSPEIRLLCAPLRYLLPPPSEAARGCGMTRMQGSQTGPQRAWHKGRGVSSVRSLPPIPQAGTGVSCAQQSPQSLPAPHSFLCHPSGPKGERLGRGRGGGRKTKGGKGGGFWRKPSGGPLQWKTPRQLCGSEETRDVNPSSSPSSDHCSIP